MKTSKKAAGFYVTLFSCILAIASAICYGVLFKGIEYKEPVFDVRICVIMAAVGIVAAVLLLVVTLVVSEVVLYMKKYRSA